MVGDEDRERWLARFESLGVDALRDEVERLDGVLRELREVRHGGPITVGALAGLIDLFTARWTAAAGVLSRRGDASAAVVPAGAPVPVPPVEPVPAVQPPAVQPAPTVQPPAVAVPPRSARPPAAAEAKRPRPPQPTLREFLGDHSILLVSYTGAFLLVVATVLYELYAASKLDGQLRFAGVLVLDVNFGLAGWLCLRSRRLRLVAQTYIAVFALLAPLVLVAAYVFLGLPSHGISVHVAQLLTGATLTVLYGALAVRLRSHAYAYLALVAVPVAWLGVLDQAGLTIWRGPALAPLAGCYAVVAGWSRRVEWAGAAFSRHTAFFVHGAALLAVGLAVGPAVVELAWSPWVTPATLGIIGASYVGLRLLGGDRVSSAVGLGALVLAWAGAVTDAHLGAWRGTAVVLLAPPVLLACRAPGAARALAEDARLTVHAAALLGLFLCVTDLATAGSWLPWRLAAVTGAATAAYAAAWLLEERAEFVLPAAAAFGLTWVVAVGDLGLGVWRAAACAAVTFPFVLARRLPRAGRPARLLLGEAGAYLVRGGAVAALAFLVQSGAGGLSWPAAATYGILGIAYLALAWTAADQVAAHLGLAGLGGAWIAAVSASGHGPSAAVALALFGVTCAVLAVTRDRLIERPELAVAAGDLLPVAAALALIVGAAREGPAAAGSWTFAGVAALVTAAYAVASLRGGGAEIVLPGAFGFGLAWVVAVDALGIGTWRAALDAPLVFVYVLAGRAAGGPGQVGRWLRMSSPYLAGAAAAVTLAIALADAAATGTPLTWQAAAAFAGLGLTSCAAARLTRRRLEAGFGVVGLAVAWVLATGAAGLIAWESVALALLVVAGTVAGRVASGRDAWRPLGRVAGELAHAAAVLALLVGGGRWAAELLTSEPLTWGLPAACAVLTVGYGLRRVLAGGALWTVPAAALASAAVLSASAALDLGLAAAAVELLALAAGWGLGAELARDPTLRRCLRAGLALQALAPVLFTSLPAGTEAAVLLGSAGLLALGAWRARWPLGLAAAGLVTIVDWGWLGAADWGWLGAATARLGPAPPVSVALWYSPLPVLLTVAGLALRAGAGRDWAAPVLTLAALLGPAVAAVALAGGDAELAGRALLAYGATAYVVAAIEGWWTAMVGAAAAGAAGVVLALAGGEAPWFWYQAALGALAVTIYAGQVPWEGREDVGPDWVRAHRFVGLGGTAAVAGAGFVLPGATGPASLGAVVALLTELALAVVLAREARHRGLPALEYVAVPVAASASFFLARFLDATDPQWYVLVPGLALLALGLRAPYDGRLAVDRRVVHALTGLGAVLLLGTTALQAMTGDGWGSTTLLVGEGVAALLAGIATRSRTLVVAGAAAIGVSGLRALFVFIEQGLLFVAFGVAAVALLGLGTALALLRDRFQQGSGAVRAAWREWY